jgi:very-short-patch-repair endonuclease
MLETRNRQAWALVRRQHGVVARRQLLALGFSAKAIEHRLRRRRLHRVAWGVYAVGRRELSREGRWMAAVLSCGDAAGLSHRSAAALWGIAAECPGRIDVSVRRDCYLRRPGVDVRVRTALPAERVRRRLWIPVTTPVQTLVDLATELVDDALERAVNEADTRDLIDPESLRSALDAFAGEPGAPRLRTLLDRHTFRLSDSDLEILFRRIVRPTGLPYPETKVWILGFEVDFHFPSLGLVVETDGLRYHRTPAQQARAARRDQTHTAAGLRVLRFTHYQVKYEPSVVRDVLIRTAATVEAAR